MGKMKRLLKPLKKIKRLSRKQKINLPSHEVKNYVRWKWEQDKMHSILDTAMHFNTLKITADPQIDIDFVRGMSTVSIYDRNYRPPVQEIPEDSPYVRFNVMHQLNNLNIDHESEDKCSINIPQQDIESDILQKTSFLYISDSSEPNMSDRISNIDLS